MKVLGVEFHGYACFEHQFVSLRPGINLLVGRNNVGKTALLRGLTVLKALPIESMSSFGLNLVDYVRPRETFGVDLLFSIGQSGRNFFEEGDVDYINRE